MCSACAVQSCGPPHARSCHLPTSPASLPAVKVRSGQGRTREVLSPQLAAAIGAKWGEYAGPKTGYASYAEMRAGVNAELGRPFE